MINYPQKIDPVLEHAEREIRVLDKMLDEAHQRLRQAIFCIVLGFILGFSLGVEFALRKIFGG